MGVGGGRWGGMEGSREKKKYAGDSGRSLLVGPGKKYGTMYTKKVAYSWMFLQSFTFAATLCLVQQILITYVLCHALFWLC